MGFSAAAMQEYSFTVKTLEYRLKTPLRAILHFVPNKRARRGPFGACGRVFLLNLRLRYSLRAAVSVFSSMWDLMYFVHLM